MTQTRREHDSLGPVEVPADRLWGAQTQRSLENFPIGRGRFVWGRPVIRAFGILKKAAALANVRLGQLPAERVEPIVRAADEIIAGVHDGEFPLVVFQTGSGTQSNMNANEVIARRASQLGVAGGAPIHPNDDVNRSQSSNDAFPAVMHIAAVEAIEGALLPALGGLREALAERGRALGADRHHRADASDGCDALTLGQLFSGWTAQLDQAGATIRALARRALRAAARRHGGRHRAQRAAGLRRACRRADRRRDRPAVPPGGQSVRARLRARCDGHRQRRCAPWPAR